MVLLAVGSAEGWQGPGVLSARALGSPSRRRPLLPDRAFAAPGGQPDCSQSDGNGEAMSWARSCLHVSRILTFTGASEETRPGFAMGGVGKEVKRRRRRRRDDCWFEKNIYPSWSATLCGHYAESLPGLDSFNPFVIP